MKRQGIRIFTPVLVLAVLLTLALGACTTTGTSSVASTAPSSVASTAPSSEATSVVSEPTSSQPTASSEDTEVSQPTEPADWSKDWTAEEQAIFDITNARRSAAGLDAFAASDRLNTAAGTVAQALAEAGAAAIRSSDFKTLPDGSRITAAVNAAVSADPALSNIDYSIWVSLNPESPADFSALRSDALAGEQYATKLSKAHDRLGVGVGCTENGPLVLVIFYADDLPIE